MSTTKKINAIIFVLATFIFNSCTKNDLPVNTLPDSVSVVNNFIYQTTNDYYLWNDHIPAGINVNDYPNSYDLFDAMYYPTLDHWSFVTDDYQSVLDGLNGSRKTTGARLQLFKFQTGDNIFGVVEYVYEGGPAAVAGILRGDVIISVNGRPLLLIIIKLFYRLMLWNLVSGRL